MLQLPEAAGTGALPAPPASGFQPPMSPPCSPGAADPSPWRVSQCSAAPPAGRITAGLACCKGSVAGKLVAMNPAGGHPRPSLIEPPLRVHRQWGVQGPPARLPRGQL
ncbi:vezatin [Platysternon megacephalum]|uniref:Vezatin n=1 Tax=Platysternon megacephalum TaxID=55544 RepID=A0A4D9EEE9_9SAUR|nr:vezatin [Platysternon megacephalum]